MKAEFPALHALVGDQVFDLFTEGYISAHPPTSYSLFDLGTHFADHLDGTRPTPPGPLDALPAAVARLERARAECRRAPGPETDPAHQPVDPFTAMTTPDLVVRTPPTLRLLHLDFAVHDTLTAADQGDRPTIPAATETHYAVTRTRYRVQIHVLAPWQYAFLHSCTNNGTALHTATTTAARHSGHHLPRIWAALLTWLPFAVDAGMATCGKPPGEHRLDKTTADVSPDTPYQQPRTWSDIHR